MRSEGAIQSMWRTDWCASSSWISMHFRNRPFQHPVHARTLQHKRKDSLRLSLYVYIFSHPRPWDKIRSRTMPPFHLLDGGGPRPEGVRNTLAPHPEAVPHLTRHAAGVEDLLLLLCKSRPPLQYLLRIALSFQFKRNITSELRWIHTGSRFHTFSGSARVKSVRSNSISTLSAVLLQTRYQ